jgi:hypothetical protein
MMYCNLYDWKRKWLRYYSNILSVTNTDLCVETEIKVFYCQSLASNAEDKSMCAPMARVCLSLQVECSQYSDSAGWTIRGSIFGSAKQSFYYPDPPDRLRGPFTLLCEEHRGPYPEVKRPGRDVDLSTLYTNNIFHTQYSVTCFFSLSTSIS